MWARGWAWLVGAHGWAGQGWEELKTGPAALLGQGLVAMGGLQWGPGVWGESGEPQGSGSGTVRAGGALRTLIVIFEV